MVSLRNIKCDVKEKDVYSKVLCPEDCTESEDFFTLEEEWMAENVLDFFNVLNVYIFGRLDFNKAWKKASEEGRLPNQGYPPNTKYKWKDGEHEIAKILPVNINVEKFCIYLDNLFENEDVFSINEDTPYPEDIRYYIRRIMTLINPTIFRIYAIPGFGGLDSFFEYFIFFSWKWNLLPDDETKCMKNRVKPLKKKFKAKEAEYNQF
eukprot:snap_masked-scaffold_50-processed-gene-0.7-mRNA-1 protein AED:0.32 eAED:1.00 QI:0/0/0/1/1/1/2/0/206